MARRPARDRRAAALHAAAVAAGFGLLFAVFFAPVWLAGRVLAPGDATLFYYPAYHLPRAGWTPLLLSGFPIQGDPQTFRAYPLALLLGALPRSWNAFVMAAYVVASCNAYLYGYGLTRSRLSAALCGLVYGLCGYGMAHLGHTSLVHAMAWAPLVFRALEGLRQPAGAGGVALGAAAVACCATAGHPQILVYTGAAGAAYAALRGRGAPVGGARYAVRCAAAGGLGIGLAAVALLPAAELARHSLRSELSYADFMFYSLRFQQLPQLLFPYLYGGWYDTPLGLAARGYFARVPLAEVTGFVGLLPLVLAVVAWRVRRGDPRVRFWSAAALLVLLVSLGRHLPVSAPLYWLPVYNQFRIMPRHLFLGSLAVAALAAVGLQALRSLPVAERRRALRAGLAAVGAAAGVALAIFLAVQLSGTWQKYRLRAGVELAAAMPWRNPLLALQLLAVALGLAALLGLARGGGRRAAAALLPAVALELASFGWFAEWQARSPRPDAAFRMPEALAPLRAELGESGQRLTPLVTHGPAAAAPPNRSALFGLPSTGGYGPLLLRRYAELLDLGPAGFRSAAALAPAHRGLDLLASRYLLAPEVWLASDDARARESRRHLAAGARWRPAPGPPGVAVYENRRALPRAWLVGEARVVSPEVALAVLRGAPLPDGSGFDPAATALLEAPPAGPLACPHPCGTVEIERLADTRVELRSHARGAALLVASDVFHPGWRAFVDDEPAPLLRADAVLRAVPVPAGTHRVRFEFRSASFRSGAVLSGVSLALWLGLLPRIATGAGARSRPLASG